MYDSIEQILTFQRHIQYRTDLWQECKHPIFFVDDMQFLESDFIATLSRTGCKTSV